MATLSLNTNLSALATQGRLGASTAKLEKSFERLSSGLRISCAADDAAGLAVSESLRTDSRVFAQGVRNLNDGVSVTSIAESTLDNLTSIVTRVQELAQQSANGTLSNAQRKALDAEAQALAKEYFRVSRVAAFNGLRLFDGSTQSLRFQAGYGESAVLNAALGGELGTGTVSGTATYSMDGYSSQAVELADLNGDGFLDLVSAGSAGSFDGYATVRLGRGDGSFGQATSYATENYSSKALSLGDLNGDGLLDLVTAGTSDSNDGYATVRLGRGDGTFGGATSWATEAGASTSVSLGDLNGDGLMDLVTAGYNDPNDGYATVRLGRGDGTFREAFSYVACANWATAVSLGDLNGDGFLDLVTGGRDYGGLVTIRLGRGDGTFGPATSFVSEESGSYALSLSDLNGDGVQDLVTAGGTETAGSVTVRLGRGDGSFGQAASYAAEGRSSYAVELGDLNGDGILDLATGGDSVSYDAYVTIRLGRGDGSFANAISSRIFSASTEDSAVYGLAIGDATGDGVLDVIGAGFGRFSGSYEGAVQVLLGESREGISPLLPFSLKTKADALQAIPMLAQTLIRTAAQRGTIGATQSRIATALSNLQVARENYDSARSQITDVDVACESAELLKGRIIREAAAAILGQANQAPALALALLTD